jgi:hypothetical protein
LHLIVVLIYSSLMIRDAGFIFHKLLGNLYIFFVEMSIQILYLFLVFF